MYVCIYYVCICELHFQLCINQPLKYKFSINWLCLLHFISFTKPVLSFLAKTIARKTRMQVWDSKATDAPRFLPSDKKCTTSNFLIYQCHMSVCSHGPMRHPPLEICTSFFSIGGLYRDVQLPPGDDPGTNTPNHLNSMTPRNNALFLTSTATAYRLFLNNSEKSGSSGILKVKRDPLSTSCSPTEAEMGSNGNFCWSTEVPITKAILKGIGKLLFSSFKSFSMRCR